MGTKFIWEQYFFPKKYLESIGIKKTRKTNQIANYAWLEWTDNTSISDKPPIEYWPKMFKKILSDERKQFMHWHALPDGWEKMEYDDFLEKRRILMAKIIKEGFEHLKSNVEK